MKRIRGNIIWIVLGSIGTTFAIAMYAKGVYKVHAGVLGKVPTWLSLVVSLAVVVVNVLLLVAKLRSKEE